MASYFETIERDFVDSLAVLVLTAEFQTNTEYRKGWFDGYSIAWTKLTGKSSHHLIKLVNEVLDGSGKPILVRN